MRMEMRRRNALMSSISAAMLRRAPEVSASSRIVMDTGHVDSGTQCELPMPARQHSSMLCQNALRSQHCLPELEESPLDLVSDSHSIRSTRSSTDLDSEQQGKVDVVEALLQRWTTIV